MLNGQTSNWKEVLAGVPQGSILGPLFFLVYINDLPDGMQSNVKIFADDTLIFSVMTGSIRASATLNYDLNLISNWADRWTSKQAKEILFSKKRSTTQLSDLIFNKKPKRLENSQLIRKT